MVSPPVFVVQTWYVETGGRTVIECVRPERPRGERLIVSTTNPAVIRDALAAEGLPLPVLVTYYEIGADRICTAIADALLPEETL